MAKTLPRRFFRRPTLDVAEALVGCELVHGRRVGRIVETEAYLGANDRGSHAARGMTPRTRVMFGRPGHAYVYLIYGIHHCFNVVTEPDGTAGAVLVRALEPVRSLDGENLRGPGRLCRVLDIDRRHDGIDLTRGPLRVRGPGEPRGRIVATPRIGIDYAGSDALLPYRFIDDGSEHLSRPLRTATSR